MTYAYFLFIICATLTISLTCQGFLAVSIERKGLIRWRNVRYTG